MRPGHQDLIFGVNAVLEMLKGASSEIVEILLSDDSDRGALRTIRSEAQHRNVPTICVGSKTLDRLAIGQRHQGVIARAKAYRYLSLEEVLERTSAPEMSERILVLDGVTDPRNFGALIRTAEAAGVRHIIIPKDRSAEVTPVVTKAAAGATSHVGVAKVINLRRAIRQLKEQGFWVVGLDATGRQSIYERQFPAKLAIVLGNEGGGVRPINLRECDFVVSIPMLGVVSSLNVSVAGAVFLYELVRQSSAQGKGAISAS